MAKKSSTKGPAQTPKKGKAPKDDPKKKKINWLKFIALSLAAMGFLMAFVFVRGNMFDEEHRVQVRVRFVRPLNEVWKTLSDIKAQTDWNKSLDSVTLESENPEIWAENYSGRVLRMETVERVENQRLVRRLVGDDLPFGGTWTYELKNLGGETLLTLTEEGHIKNPMFRFRAHSVCGLNSSLKAAVEALETRLGKAAEESALP